MENSDISKTTKDENALSDTDSVKKTKFILSEISPYRDIKENASNKNKKSGCTTLNTSTELESNILSKVENIGSPFIWKFGKKIETDSEKDDTNKKNNNDSASIITSSSDESEGRKMQRKYDIEYSSFKRSKSTSGLFKHQKSFFATVREEKLEDEDNDVDTKSTERFKKINLMIQNEGYDNVEESYSEHKPKLLSTRSTKCLSLMDPVLEVKEEIDFNQIKFQPFKKLKFIVDNEEDTKIGNNSNHHYNRFDVEEAIEEDNRENDLELEIKHKKYHTHNIKKLPEFVDKSERIKQVETKMYITEEIKEDTEHEENIDHEIIHNNKRK